MSMQMSPSVAGDESPPVPPVCQTARSRTSRPKRNRDWPTTPEPVRNTRSSLSVPLALMAVVIASMVLFASLAAIDARLGPRWFASGSLLTAVILLVCGLPVVRQLPRTLCPPAVWVSRIHAYSGTFAIAAYLAHAGIRIPDGWIEATLASLFGLFTVSGIVLSMANRTVPRRIAAYDLPIRGCEIPRHRKEIVESVAELITLHADAPEQSDSVSVSEVLGTHVTKYVLPRLGKSPSWWQVASPRKGAHATWLRDIAARRRYLKGSALAKCDRLMTLLRRDDSLHAIETWSMRLRLLHRTHQTGVLVFWIAILLHIGVVVAMNGLPIAAVTSP